MSNETDLDCLARNVHVWPTNTPKAILPGDATFKLGAVFYGDCVAFSGELGPEYRRVNKADWLARRAELQEKPSWGAVPSHANWLAQDAAGSWLWHSSEPECRNGGWIGSTTRGYAAKGCVIGDWRDTLEKRPEEFKPFTSIEDNQGQDMTQQHDMKQDNGWFERGELPPVGCECEILGAFGHYQEWFPCKIIAEHSGSVFAANERAWINVKHGERKFRPIRTEREKQVDELESLLRMTSASTLDHLDVIAAAIYAAGFRKESK